MEAAIEISHLTCYNNTIKRGDNMPEIRPITDLRDKSAEIIKFCNATQEPVFITQNGIGELAVLSMKSYERMQERLNLYSQLAESEDLILNGDKGVDFETFTADLKEKVNSV